jgi:hypothetical protein
MARTKLFDPASAEPFKVSRNKVEEHVRCSRCSVMNLRYGLKKPSSPPFTLNSAVDGLLKKELDVHREAQTVHPIVADAGLELVPFQHPQIDEWRSNFKGIQFLHERLNLLLTGAVDDIWVNRDGELVVVDYKATAKAEPMIEVPTGGFYDSYRRQLDFYQWLLRQLGFKVSKTSYWLYCTGRPGADGFDKTLQFDTHLIAYESDDSWIEEFLQGMVEDLRSEGLPDSAEACEHCSYVEKRQELEETYDLSRFPHCPNCGSMMSRIIYGLPSGPPPPHHVTGGCIVGFDSPQFECEVCAQLEGGN